MNKTNLSYKEKIAERLREKKIRHQFIPLPNDMFLDTASYIAFHGISTEESVPTLIYRTERGFIAVQKRSDTKIDLKKLKALVGVKRLNFANIDELKQLGAKPGIVPLVGMDLPYYLDRKVLDIKEIYGGSGSKNFTLKLKSKDLVNINNATVGDFTYLNEGEKYDSRK